MIRDYKHCTLKRPAAESVTKTIVHGLGTLLSAIGITLLLATVYTLTA
jgi:hypothetical protein